MPDLTVVIPCHDGNRTLELQLEALSRQIGAPDHEVIVVDNLSSDPPDRIIDKMSGRVRGLRLVRAMAEPGTSYARNVGLREARANRVAMCDADDCVGPHFLASAYQSLDDVDVATGGSRLVAESEFARGLDHVWEILGEDESKRDRSPVPVDPNYPVLMGGACAMRRDVALSLQGFDQSFFPGAEDNDFAVRAVRSGFRVAIVPGIRLAERGRSTSAGLFRRGFDSGRMHMALCERHDLWDSSPHLNHPRWWVDLARLPVAGVRAMVTPSAVARSGFTTRAAVRLGQGAGWVDIVARRRPLAPRLGVGLTAEDPMDSFVRRPILVLSPHLDDAVFSASEVIRRTRPEVWTVFAGEPQPPQTTDWERRCGARNSHELSVRRRGEDIEALADVARVRHLDCLEGPHTTPQRRRGDLTSLSDAVEAWISSHEGQDPIIVLPACAGVSVRLTVLDVAIERAKAGRRVLDGLRFSSGMQQACASSDFAVEGAPRMEHQADLRWNGGAALIDILRRAKHESYQHRRRKAQAKGLAVNPDHVAVRDTCLSVATGHPGLTVILMEDLPYLWSHRADEAVRHVCSRWRLPFRAFTVESDRPWKASRCAAYESQTQIMDPQGRLTDPERLPPVERYWVAAVAGRSRRR
ncbi:glycosyltransferase [Acidipropionibacterium timonense]|uniref:glycosyltransferase n=1 Tax=Acidipropionibacterium timonense TaxID=2161818 RepID=UPI00143688D1|nr:glycosyltransferase [Acidipropionibacterium timonense]